MLSSASEYLQFQDSLSENLHAMMVSSPLSEETGGDSSVKFMRYHWYQNHCLKRHSLLTELPIAWNEEIPVHNIYLCKNMWLVKKHLSMEIKWFSQWVVFAINSPPANRILWSDWPNKSLELNHWKKNLSQHLESHKTADSNTNEKSTQDMHKMYNTS